MKKTLLCLLLTVCLLLSAALPCSADTVSDALSGTAVYLTDTIPADFGSEWVMLGLSRGGCTVPDGYYERYIDNAGAYVADTIDENGRLSPRNSTENSRLILALTALQVDPRTIGGANLLTALSDFAYLQKQGLSGPVWALLALDSNRYTVPEAAEGVEQTTRENLIAYILSRQVATGGWTFGGDTADPDMTGTVIQALAPYYTADQAVKAAVDKALGVLSETQLSDGSFESWGTANAASCAQVVTALTALGIDPTADPRFIKNGQSVLDAMLSFRTADGGFQYAADSEADVMTTGQAFYALVAYQRLQNGQTSLYDMSDLYRVWGDLDGNGTLELADALALYTHVSGTAQLGAATLEPADLNGDESVDMNDALTLYRCAAGLLPAC